MFFSLHCDVVWHVLFLKNWRVALQHPLTLLLVISSTYISVTMKHKIVTAILIYIRDTFRPYSAIIRCTRYAELFTAMLVSYWHTGCTHTTEHNNALRKRDNGLSTKETYMKENNVHTNINGLHETHSRRRRLAIRYHKEIEAVFTKFNRTTSFNLYFNRNFNFNFKIETSSAVKSLA
jgi:hypothetical protein